MSLARKLGRAVGSAWRTTKAHAKAARQIAGEELCARCLERCKPKGKQAPYVRSDVEADDQPVAHVLPFTRPELRKLLGKPQSSGEWVLEETGHGMGHLVVFERGGKHWVAGQSGAALRRFSAWLSKRVKRPTAIGGGRAKSGHPGGGHVTEEGHRPKRKQSAA